MPQWYPSKHVSQPLRILNNKDVRHLLHRLTKEETESLYDVLAEAFHTYSTDSNSTIQTPKPTKLKVHDGQTTVFSASSMGPAAGLQIISKPPTDDRINQHPPFIHHGSTSSSLSEVSASPSQNSGLHSNSSVSSASGMSTPSSTSTEHTEPENVWESLQNLSVNDRPATPPTPVRSGSPVNDAIQVPRSNHLLLINPENGQPQGLVASQSLTTFRAALTATALLRKRNQVSNITIFGAGPLAYWHVRLSLLLRGPEIKHVNIVTLKFDRAVPLMKAFYQDCQSNITLRSNAKFQVLTRDYKGYDRLLKDNVRGADVIYCCTSNGFAGLSDPLFPHEILTNNEARRKGRYITIMGGTQAHQHELPIEFIQQVTSRHHHRHHHKHAESSGVVIVDSLDHCMKDGGEVVMAGLEGKHMVEIGELILLKKAAEQELARQSSEVSEESGQEEKSHFPHFHMPHFGKQEDKGRHIPDPTLRKWLTVGDVVLKSVGMPLIDVVIGRELLRLAEEKNIGVIVDDF